MAELTTIWNNTQLTAATLPPPFAIPNSPNAKSAQINNQSSYWVVIYKTNSNIPINRIEPFSYVMFPYESDISIEIDTTAGKVTSLLPQVQFIDYTTFDYVIGYGKGSTFFSGTGTTTITNGSTVNVGTMPGVNVTGGNINAASNITNQQLQVAQIYSTKASYSVPITTTTTVPFQFNLQFLNNGTLANVHHIDVYITSSQGKSYNLAGSAAFAVMSDGTSWNASSNYTTTFNGANSFSLDGAAIICNVIQLQIELVSGTLSAPDNITVYFAIDSNETSIGTTDGVLVKPYSTNIVDLSGSITTANVSQQVLSAKPGRRYLFFQNLSSGALYINFNGAATVGGAGSIAIPPNGGAYTMEGSFCSSDTLYVIGATAGAPYTCKFY